MSELVSELVSENMQIGVKLSIFDATHCPFRPMSNKVPIKASQVYMNEYNHKQRIFNECFIYIIWLANLFLRPI